MYDSIQQAARRSHIQVTTIQTARTQADQIDAIRTLLVYRTNAIIFSPVMENGWEYILSEAAEAEIPLITINERLSQSAAGGPQDSACQVYHVGFDYYALSGQLAATLCQSGSDGFQLVQLGGTVASSAGARYLGRVSGFAFPKQPIPSLLQRGRGLYALARL